MTFKIDMGDIYQCKGCGFFTRGPCQSCEAGTQAMRAVFPYRKHEGAVLPTDAEERKGIPIFSGFLNYFPLAVAAVARHSKRANEKHNPGQPLHWAREKSTDQEDCIGRHLIDIETVNADGEYEDATALVWRALAKLEILEEKRLGKPMSRGSK
jgi:hypothetical protein